MASGIHERDKMIKVVALTVSDLKRGQIKAGQSALKVALEDGKAVAFYSYTTTIAVVNENNVMEITSTKYSMTTSHHCSAIKRFCERRNMAYEVV